jgi:hypothetical protein
MTQTNANLAYAVKLAHAVCCLSGSPSYIDDLRDGLHDRGIVQAIRNHDTAALFGCRQSGFRETLGYPPHVLFILERLPAKMFVE